MQKKNRVKKEIKYSTKESRIQKNIYSTTEKKIQNQSYNTPFMIKDIFIEL